MRQRIRSFPVLALLAGLAGEPAMSANLALAGRDAASTLKVWYLGHCGFAVSTGTKLLVFDYLSPRGSPAADLRGRRPGGRTGSSDPQT